MSLKHAILVMLEKEPGSGYDLLRQFKQSLGYFWNASHQQIYQQLKSLNSDSLISASVECQNGKPDKKVYSITDKGRETLAEWIAQPVKPNRINDALLVKIWGGHLTSSENLMKELEKHIEIHQHTLDKLESIEQQYLSLDQGKQAYYKLPYVTLRRGILGERAWLEWANETKQLFKI
jgi:PadR family transcriptional regulator AphA